MKAVRQTLEVLGWPKELSDHEVATELLRRWFETDPPAPLTLSDPVIVARGVYATLARDGNLDALCWTPDRKATIPRAAALVDEVLSAQQGKHDDADDDYILANRRKCGRMPRPALVDVSMDYGARRALAWLVDISSDGAGLLMETLSVPSVGQHIEPVVHGRDGQPDRLGPGLVVRTELLASDIGLVGIELEEPRENLAA